MISPFAFSNIPEIIFGAGRFAELAAIISKHCASALAVTSPAFPGRGEAWKSFASELKKNSVELHHATISGEPSPDYVDATVFEYSGAGVDVVVAIGGGSVMDAGKAIAAMLPLNESVFDYLEGVGTGRQHPGTKVPFIAVPTTAGTGSEATKNAVLSRVGQKGFKKSLRHDRFVPDVAFIDPELALTCPPEITAACGLDAFTQLLEAYTSTRSSPMTDALAFSGLDRVSRSLVEACDYGDNIDARADMAYASLLSGITLANAGLGVVHGLAGPIGGCFDIPHGVICGTLLASATSANVRVLMDKRDPDDPLLRKYARAGSIFTGRSYRNVYHGCNLLVEKLEELTQSLRIPALGEYGITEKDIGIIVAAAGLKNNPAPLSDVDISDILLKRI